MKLFFCTILEPEKYNGATIYTSRILHAIHELGLDLEVAMIQFYSGPNPQPENKWVAQLQELKSKGIIFEVFPAKPRFFSFLKAYVRLLINVVQKRRNIDVFAFRLFWFQPIAVLFKMLSRKLTTLWFHDGIIEEMYFVHPDLKHRILVLIAGMFEKIGARFVDFQFPVSNKMLNYSHDKGIQGRKGSIVLPCVVETERFTPRQLTDISFKNEKPIIIGFSGSIAPWHGFEEGCRFLEFLGKHHYIKFRVLTPTVERAKKILDSYLIDYIIETVKHNEVSQRMDYWDFALVPAIGGLCSQVSSPLKATEALAKGHPLIVTPETGDFADIIRKENVGIVFDPDNESSWSSTLDSFRILLDNYGDVSKKARKIAIERYGIDNITKILRITLNI